MHQTAPTHNSAMHNDPKLELDGINEMIRVESGSDAAAMLEAEAARDPFAPMLQDKAI